jgi:FAD:protein FMN transferase
LKDGCGKISRIACRDAPRDGTSGFPRRIRSSPMTPGTDTPGLHRFRRDLMHTAFEAILAEGPDPVFAAQAAQEAFRTAEAIESEFSRFLPNSDVSRINRLEPGQSVLVCIDTFECLKRGLEMREMTGGAFDVTAETGRERPETDGSGRPAAESDRPRIVLDGETFEVTVTGRIALDLGGIGKGYAVDRMIGVLREWELPAALVHGGKSSVSAYGGPDGCTGWPVTLRRPAGGPEPGVSGACSDGLIGRIELNGRSMAASGLEKGPHIIDPRTGLPVTGRIAAWAFADDATTADCLSTAFMVMEPESVRAFCARNPSVSAIVIGEDGIVQRFGTEQFA